MATAIIISKTNWSVFLLLELFFYRTCSKTQQDYSIYVMVRGVRSWLGFGRFCCRSSETTSHMTVKFVRRGLPLPLSLYWSDWIDQITSTPIDRSLVMRTFKTRPLQTVKYTLLISRIDRSVSDTSRVFLVPPTDKDRWKTIINRVTRQPLVCCIVDYLITNSSRAFNSP